jgi:hypothetical protein
MDPRTKLWKHQLRLVREVLNRYDPAGLIGIGCPEDEYDPEMAGVFRAIRDARDAADLGERVARVFRGMLGGALVSDRWPEIGAELWRLTRTQYWHDPPAS